VIASVGPGLSCGSPGLGPFELLEQAARLLFVSSGHPGRMVVASLKLASVCCQLGIEGVLGRRRLLPCAGNSGPKLLELGLLRCSLPFPLAPLGRQPFPGASGAAGTGCRRPGAS
jgi:hypothetical protein